MSFFSLMFPTVTEEELERGRRNEAAKSPALAAEVKAEEGIDEATVAAITAALEAALNGENCESRLSDRVGRFDPWSMKFFGLRANCALRNPWLQGRRDYSAWSKR